MLRTVAALVIAATTWVGAQVLVSPTMAEDTAQLGQDVTTEQLVSQAVARDLERAGMWRFNLAGLDEAEAEWLPQLLIRQGWTSTPGDGCECLYPPMKAI